MPSGELFIVFQKNSNIQWEKFTHKISLDGIGIDQMSKINGDLLTVLVTYHLKPGEHKLNIRFTAKGSIPMEANCAFTMAGRKDSAATGATPEKPNFSMHADLQLRSRFTDLSGPGSYLRQEPKSLQTVNFLGSTFYKNLEFPFRFYVTNQEQSSLQWRNTFMLGMKTKRLGIFVGDVFPDYHRHLLFGSKIRGGRAWVKMGNVQLDVSHGVIQRSLEGALRQYDVALGFPPVNLETSTGLFISPGSYRRNVTAMQLRFVGRGTKQETSFSVLYGKDDEASIQYGGPSGQNLVFGFNYKLSSKNRAVELDAGTSISITTRDTRLGTASSQDIKDVYDRDPPIDPASIDQFFTLNASTTPYRITGLPSATGFANLKLNVLQQHLNMQYERVGSAFYTYGMPFLINDRQTIAAGDWVHLLQRRVMLSANYRYYVNNLSKEKPTTQETGNLQASLRIQTAPKWPQILFSYNDFRRNGVDNYLDKTQFKNTIQTWTTGLVQNFTIGGSAKQSASLSFSRNKRADELRANNDFFTNSLNARLSSELTHGLQLTLEYQFLLLSNDTSDFNRQNGYGLRLRYQSPNKKFNLSAGARQFRTAETFFTPEANRQLFDFRLEYVLKEKLSLSLQVGQSQYEEAQAGNRNYDEKWGELGIRYRWQ